jgi:hypothetical protein
MRPALADAKGRDYPGGNEPVDGRAGDVQTLGDSADVEEFGGGALKHLSRLSE